MKSIKVRQYVLGGSIHSNFGYDGSPQLIGYEAIEEIPSWIATNLTQHGLINSIKEMYSSPFDDIKFIDLDVVETVTVKESESHPPLFFCAGTGVFGHVENCTPHEVTIAEKIFPANKKPARVEQIDSPTRETIGGIEIYTPKFGEVYDLPEPIEDYVFIVSMMVKDACPDRTDLVSPGGLVRDDSGRIIGAKYLLR